MSAIRRRATLTEGPVRTHLVRMTLPMIGGLSAMMGFNLADTYFVAQLGSAELAAMSFTFPVVLAVTSLGIGLMAGTSSVLARLIGEGDESRTRRLATHALILATAVAVLLAMLGLATIEPLFRLLGADEPTLELIADYMRIWYLGMIFMLPPMAGVGAIRATGDSAGQSMVLIAGSVANMVLDPLLIFGLLGLPRMELEGAALASIIARVLTLGPGFYLMHVRHDLLELRRPSLPGLADSLRRLSRVAAPAAGTNLMFPLAMAVVTALVARHGTEAVAGFGAAFRIESVSLIVFYAMSSIVGPLVGQNLGAGKHARVADTIALGTWFCLGLGVVLAAMLALAAPALSALFSDDPAVLATSVGYLSIVPWCYGAAGIVMIVNAAFNGIGRPLAATGVSLTRLAVFYLPLTWAGGAIAGVSGIFIGIALANLGAGAVASVWWRRTLPRLGGSSAATIAAPAASPAR